MAYIKKLPTGRYCAQIYLGRDPVTHKTRWESKTFDREKDADQWAKALEVKRDDGKYKPTVSTATFADFLRETWLPAHSEQVRSSYNTEKTISKWILRPQSDTPFLGPVKLRSLTVDHFDKLYKAMRDAHGIRPRGIQHVHSLLRRAMKYAVAKNKLANNPTDNATVPTGKLGPARYLTEEQERRFIAAAKKERLTALWHLLLDSGVRPGEAFALKWEPDTSWQSEGAERPRWGWVDLDQKLVCVRATLSRLGVDKDKEGWTLTPPKTENSERDVPVSDDTVTELKRWRKQQITEQLKAGPHWQHHGFVFTTELGTPLGDNVRRAWTSVMKEADGGKGDIGKWGEEPEKPRSGPTPSRSFTPHYSMYVLRHTMISLNFLDGMDLALLSRRAGHDDPAFTFKRYGRGVRANASKVVADNTQRRWRAGSSS